MRLSLTVARLLIREDPLVGKTVYNVCGLACILKLTSSNRQVSLISRERSAQSEWCPPTRVDRHHKSRVPVKILTGIPFKQCAFL